MISFYISTKRFCLKSKGLFEGKVVLLTKLRFFSTLFKNLHKVFKINI